MFPILQPVILLVLFVAIFSGLASVPGVTYRQFLVPGIIILNITLTTPTVGLGMVTDASTGLADRFRSLPMARSAVLTGRLLSEALVFLAQVVVLIAVASLMGFRIHSGIPGLVGIMLDGVAFGVALGVTECWLALRLRDPRLLNVPCSCRWCRWPSSVRHLPRLIACRAGFSRWRGRIPLPPRWMLPGHLPTAGLLERSRST